MKSKANRLQTLASASAVALIMGFAGSAGGVQIIEECVVNTTDPDAKATVTSGDASFADPGCGLGDAKNEKGSTLLDSWTFFGKYDATGNAGNLTGWSVTGFTGAPNGTWSIDSDTITGLFADDLNGAGLEFLLVLKDGKGANPAGAEPDTNWVWFEFDPFKGTSGGDWYMYGNGKEPDPDRKNSSHMSLYVKGGDIPSTGRIPEPGMLSLLGVGLLGQVWLLRRRRQKK